LHPEEFAELIGFFHARKIPERAAGSQNLAAGKISGGRHGVGAAHFAL
jgi:hypothetical protein